MERPQIFTMLRAMVEQGLLNRPFSFSWNSRPFLVTRIYQDEYNDLVIDYSTPEYSRDSFIMSEMNSKFLNTLVHEAKLQCQRDRNLF